MDNESIKEITRLSRNLEQLNLTMREVVKNDVRRAEIEKNQNKINEQLTRSIHDHEDRLYDLEIARAKESPVIRFLTKNFAIIAVVVTLTSVLLPQLLKGLLGQ